MWARKKVLQIVVDSHFEQNWSLVVDRSSFGSLTTDRVISHLRFGIHLERLYVEGKRKRPFVDFNGERVRFGRVIKNTQ